MEYFNLDIMLYNTVIKIPGQTQLSGKSLIWLTDVSNRISRALVTQHSARKQKCYVDAHLTFSFLFSLGPLHKNDEVHS